jgi:hypothetical protein
VPVESEKVATLAPAELEDSVTSGLAKESPLTSIRYRWAHMVVSVVIVAVRV